MIQLNTDQLTAHHQHVQTNLFPLLCLSIELRQHLLVWSLPGLRLGLRLEIQSESEVASSYPATVISSAQPVSSESPVSQLSFIINKTGLHTIPGITSARWAAAILAGLGDLGSAVVWAEVAWHGQGYCTVTSCSTTSHRKLSGDTGWRTQRVEKLTKEAFVWITEWTLHSFIGCCSLHFAT